MPVRFSTLGADGKESLGPDTIMVGVWPGTTTVKEGQEASEEILALLKSQGEWSPGCGGPIARVSYKETVKS